jgi:hypothetical protein
MNPDARSDFDPLDARLVELGVRVGRLLAADVRAFVPQAVRDRFLELPALADALDDAALADLKRATLEATDALAARVEHQLTSPAAWLGAVPSRREGQGTPPLTEHPPVSAMVADIADTANGLLRTHGMAVEPPLTYRLPMRFIDGDNLASLTMNFWKAVARREEHRRRADASAAAAAAGERRRRWDDA